MFIIRKRRILSNIDIRFYEKNSEGLVEIETIENTVREEILVFLKDKFNSEMFDFEKKNTWEESDDFFLLFVRVYMKFIFYLRHELKYLKKKKFKKFNKFFNFDYHNYLFYFNKKKGYFNKKKLPRLKRYFLIILNLKKIKPFINIIIKDKTLLSVSTGFVLKKLYIDEKKSRKHFKTLLLILKLTLNELNLKLKGYNRIIFNIIGSKKRLLKIINFCKKKIKFNRILFIHTPNFYQNSIKFKKIKSIKRRLKKKNLNK